MILSAITLPASGESYRLARFETDTFGTGASCPAVQETSHCAAACWSVDAGALILHRSHARSATLAEDGTTDAELANTADFDLGWAAGPRIRIARQFACGWDVDVTYFGLDGWSASQSLADVANLRVPLVSTSPTDFFDTASAFYTSRLYSTELNVGRRFCDNYRVLAGFRWVELHEAIGAEAWSPTLEGSFNSQTGNHLYGFQLGLEAVLWNNDGPFSLDGFLKAGVYASHIRMAAQGEGTYFSLDGEATRSRTSFLGEMGLVARYRLNDHWSVYGGYQVMWIEGVALAGDVVAALSSTDENMLLNGTAFYHGGLTGIEFRW
jgi:hypothetical protein